MRQLAIVVGIIWMAAIPSVAAAQTAAAPVGDTEAPPAQTFALEPAGVSARFGIEPAVKPQTGVARALNAALRRRGSMVGYIEDPIVSTKLRVRFESGFHNETPDRAEFFYAKCGCYADLPHDNPALDFEAPGPRPGAANDVNFRQLYLYGEYAPNEIVSVFGEVPARWLMPQSFIPGTGGSFPNQQGLGDIRAGIRVAVNAAEHHMLTLQVKAFMPSGDASRGLGTKHGSLEQALLFFQQAGPRVAIEGEGGLWAPLGGSVGLPTSSSTKFSGRVLFWGVGPSVEAIRTNHMRVAPAVELVGWRVLSGSATGVGDTAGASIVNLKIGARVGWDPSGSVYIGYGHALTDAAWYTDIVRFEYRVGF